MEINLGIYDVVAQIQKKFEPAIKAAESAKRWQKIVAEMAEKDQTTTQLLIAAGWPPPIHFPASGLDSLMSFFEDGTVSEIQLAKVFLTFYDQHQLNKMLDQWLSNPDIIHRMPILRESINNYLEGRYASCVALALPNIEGTIGDFLDRRPKPKDDIVEIFVANNIDIATTKFYTKIVLAQFDWKDDPILGLSRHQILHGKDTQFGTDINALKTLLLFDAIQQAILNKQRTSV